MEGMEGMNDEDYEQSNEAFENWWRDEATREAIAVKARAKSGWDAAIEWLSEDT